MRWKRGKGFEDVDGDGGSWTEQGDNDGRVEGARPYIEESERNSCM